MAQPRAEARALLDHLPDRGVALQRQRQNLVQFVAANPAKFNAMPYEPWTRVPPKGGVKGLEFEVRASTVRGLRGVFPCQYVPPTKEEQRLLYYPGLLVTGALYEIFCKQYHCPTGLGLPALRYKPDEMRPEVVDVLIIGDPTSPGAIINDGCFGGSDSQRIHHSARLGVHAPASRSSLRALLFHAWVCCELRAQVLSLGAQGTRDNANCGDRQAACVRRGCERVVACGHAAAAV